MLSNILIMGLIVIIFIAFCILYNNKNQTSDIEIENKTQMLELMNEAKKNAKEQINKNTQEKFDSLSSSLTQDEANAYQSELNFLNYWIQNNSGNNGIMGQINELVQNANNSRIANKKVLVDILTNMYSMAYLDFLNHQNTEAYKIYAKYSNPRNNKYYTQFLNS
jgi:hypothetical protein